MDSGCSLIPAHRKHELTHTKPHCCNVPGCDRGLFRGFPTVNDLRRHMKSRHQIFPTNVVSKVYRCAAVDCNDIHKLWPRLDNFKQHIDRLHRGEDKDDLVRR